MFLPGKGKGGPEWKAFELGVGECECGSGQWGMWERKGYLSCRTSRGGTFGERTVGPLVEHRGR